MPLKYLNQADPGITLTKITDNPDQYKGKVVVLAAPGSAKKSATDMSGCTSGIALWTKTIGRICLVIRAAMKAAPIG